MRYTAPLDAAGIGMQNRIRCPHIRIQCVPVVDRLSATALRTIAAWPEEAESFRFSTDPELVGKFTDICGLYLAPPQSAVVLCVVEKSQIQALDSTVPILPMQEGRIERKSHDYYRHGTSTLFAALDIATGEVTAALKPQHRHQEFLVPQADRAHLPPRPRRGRRPGLAAPGDAVLVEPVADLCQDGRWQQQLLPCHVQVAEEVVGRVVMLVPMVGEGHDRPGVADDHYARSLPKPRDTTASTYSGDDPLTGPSLSMPTNLGGQVLFGFFVVSRRTSASTTST